MVDKAFGLGSAYHVRVEKVYLCSGLDGFIPSFDPNTKNYGCLADSPNLRHRFKILVSNVTFVRAFEYRPVVSSNSLE